MTRAPQPPRTAHRTLELRLPQDGRVAPEDALDRFLDWVADTGLEPYPAQEEALLELVAGRHVILATPTGSGKSLVAAFLHFVAMAGWERSFYTSPTKALASEKFFWLCDEFGPENVGMLTGDASINAGAPIICCTAEILANMALRQGTDTQAPFVVMDEFHYYGDRGRGIAWQIPLLTLSRTQFLLMSATLGDTRELERRIRARTGREVALVTSEERPVPLDFAYSETPLHQTVEGLLESGRAPIYIVHFTQREAAEQAQALTSANICKKAARERLRDAIADFRFDSAYGPELRRLLGFGVGVHHAGLLPKHRLLVEQLSQQGLLRVICGTDTLGVGVNIPIRTVLFSKLCKWNGEKMAILGPREFRQIAGRAGRRGFDDLGSVVCQAPEHVIEQRRAQQRQASRKGKRAKARGQKPGTLSWNKDTFQRLIHQPEPPLRSQFDVTHGLLVNVLQREGRGYPAVIDLIDRSHETPVRKQRLRRAAAVIFRSLRRAGILEVVADRRTGRRYVRVGDELQADFSLNHTLSLYLVDAVSALDRDAPDFALDVLTLVEAILEDPTPILLRQQDVARGELIAKLKAAGVPFEERIRRVEEIRYPQPNAEFIYETFEIFAERHPWIGAEVIRPKAIAREIFEGYMSFVDFVRRYQIARIEGRLLRYLGDVYRTLVQNVPEAFKTEALLDLEAFFRTLLTRVDTSLLREWESRALGEAVTDPEASGPPARGGFVGPELLRDQSAFVARIRSELHALVRALSRGDFEEAARCVLQEEEAWGPGRFEDALSLYLADAGELRFTPRARLADMTRFERLEPSLWRVEQVLLDPEEEGQWFLRVEVDLRDGTVPDGPAIRMREIAV